MKDRLEVSEWLRDDSGNNRDVISFPSNHTYHHEPRVGRDFPDLTATELINLRHRRAFSLDDVAQE